MNLILCTKFLEDLVRIFRMCPSFRSWTLILYMGQLSAVMGRNALCVCRPLRGSHYPHVTVRHLECD